MKTITLTDTTNDWRTIMQEVAATGAPVALAIDGAVCGILLPAPEANHVVTHYAVREQRHSQVGLVQTLQARLDVGVEDEVLVAAPGRQDEVHARFDGAVVCSGGGHRPDDDLGEATKDAVVVRQRKFDSRDPLEIGALPAPVQARFLRGLASLDLSQLRQ